MNLPEIQNHIISKLKNAGSLRYRDLKPEDTPNDLFNYHLKALVSKGIVDKVSSGYTLSKTGQAYVADVYHTSDPQLNRLFKINVITIVSRMHNGKLEILSQRRNSQPSFGMVDVMVEQSLRARTCLMAPVENYKEKRGFKQISNL